MLEELGCGDGPGGSLEYGLECGVVGMSVYGFP